MVWDSTDDDDNSNSTKEITSQLLIRNSSILIEAIIRNHVIINQQINFDTLVQFLDKYNNIFTRNEMKFLKSKDHEDAVKVNKLIEWLEGKDDIGVRNFVRALNDAHEHSGHGVILKRLHEAAFPETDL